MPDLPPVALLRAQSYGQPLLRENIFRLLDHSGITVAPGTKILVKPNLLMAHKLACTSPAVVASVCEWLLEKGGKVTVADSPAFGTAEAVAASIGLEAALAPLALKVHGFGKPVTTSIRLPGGETVKAGIAKEALECDLLFSVPRIKAHSQMRITLAVKNCYGCICGIRKALAHVRFGKSRAFFADFVAGLYASLPPVVALCDGIIAMDVTGPRNGKAFDLQLLAASASAPALDAAILAILGIPQSDIPLALALERRGLAIQPGAWPLASPDDFAVRGFQVPATLKPVTFNPLRLAGSIIRRLWLDFTKSK